MLRQYFPKGTDLSRYSRRDLTAVAATLNARPRKTLHWKTPAEALNELLLSHQQIVVVRQQSEAYSGHIVAAMIDDEATVKIFHRRNGHVFS